MVTMLDYIHEENETLSAIIEAYDFSSKDAYTSIKNVMILATGSSYNACLAAKPALESYGGLTVDIQEPFHFTHYGHLSTAVDTVIAVSQSGKSASTVTAIKAIPTESIQTIALTSDQNSPIASETDQVIDLGIGIEKVGFVTKGYSATVLQLILLGITIGVSKGQITETQRHEKIDQLKKIITEIPENIQRTEAFYEKNQALFRVAKRFIAIGYGPNWGTAKEVETKFTETVREPSQGFELEAYMHGPYLEADPSHVLFFIEAKSENQQRSRCLKEYMDPYVGATFTVTTEETADENSLSIAFSCEEYLSGLGLVVPFQVLAYKIATGKGIDLSQKIFSDFDRVLKSKI